MFLRWFIKKYAKSTVECDTNHRYLIFQFSILIIMVQSGV